MSTSKFKLRESSDGQFYFTLNAGNGQVLATSERYTVRANARNGIEAVRDNAVTEPRFNRLVSQDGQYYFVLKASNGQVLVTSETYTTAAARDGGIEAVKREVGGAVVEE